MRCAVPWLNQPIIRSAYFPMIWNKNMGKQAPPIRLLSIWLKLDQSSQEYSDRINESYGPDICNDNAFYT